MSDDVAGVSGAYFEREKQHSLQGVAADAEAAERLWAISERLVASRSGSPGP